jgi:exodeoxyribonuclease III
VLTLATVNVNGIRAAFRRGMGEWLAACAPDVLALQEVRADDEHLVDHLGPGWHVVHQASVARGRSGVAVASRLPLAAVRVGLGPSPDTPPDDEAEVSGRWVEADVELPAGGTVTVASVYVHKGEAGTERMRPKLAFLDRITARLTELAVPGGPAAVVAGDLNIAHTERDLKNWRGNVAHAGFLPQERAYLDAWLGDGAWIDVARRLAGDAAGTYTWWSWRGRAFDTDAGWRIDYQLATAGAGGRAREARVDKAPAYAARFSDHAPLVVEYDL